jgi:hypothetical protein
MGMGSTIRMQQRNGHLHPPPASLRERMWSESVAVGSRAFVNELRICDCGLRIWPMRPATRMISRGERRHGGIVKVFTGTVHPEAGLLCDLPALVWRSESEIRNPESAILGGDVEERQENRDRRIGG